MRDQLHASIDTQIGHCVTVQRILASVRVDAAAQRCGLSPADYVASERGERRFHAKELYALAICFDVKYSTFFAGLTLK